MIRDSTESGARKSRRLCAVALVVCACTAGALFLFVGDDLDTDSVLPLSSESETHISNGTDSPPSTPALVTLGVLVAVTALPVAAPRRLFPGVLVGCTALVGIFIVATALRLGLLFVPVLALQIAACSAWWGSREPHA